MSRDQSSDNGVSGLNKHLSSISYGLLPVLGAEKEYRGLEDKTMASRGNQFSGKTNIHK